VCRSSAEVRAPVGRLGGLGWHWQEKDCLPWSKERLGALLEGLPVVQGEDAVWLNVIKVQAVTGEAYVNVRKVRCC